MTISHGNTQENRPTKWRETCGIGPFFDVLCLHTVDATIHLWYDGNGCALQSKLAG